MIPTYEQTLADVAARRIEPTKTDLVQLDPSDPFESVLIRMVATNRAKRRDYALDGDVFSNFYGTSLALGLAGFGAREAALFNVLQKVERIKSLRANGRMDDPANEAIDDTYLDLAVYAVILLAIHQEKAAATEKPKQPSAAAALVERRGITP